MGEPRAIDKAAARLLRFIGHGGCRLAEMPDACRVTRPDGGDMAAAPHVIAFCIRRGLAARRGDLFLATGEARSWLRRHLAAREDAFLDQHRRVETTEIRDGDTSETVRLNTLTSPLTSLCRLRDKAGAPWLPADAVAAGERLARDFHYGALQPRVTQSYEARAGERSRPGPGAAADLSDSVIAARHRVASAVAAMGPDLSGVALDICCFEKGLETVER